MVRCRKPEKKKETRRKHVYKDNACGCGDKGATTTKLINDATFHLPIMIKKNWSSTSN